MRNKLIEVVFTAIIQGVIVSGLLGFWFNMRLETYKKELADDTERLRALIQLNEPVTQQRRSAYLDLQKAARDLIHVLEIYYAGAPTGEVWSNKLRTLENDMGIGSGFSRGSSWVTKKDVIDALGDVVSLREKNADIASGTINSAVDKFLETVMEDLGKAQQKENQTESFETAARMRLKDALSRLDGAINQALRLEELPVK